MNDDASMLDQIDDYLAGRLTDDELDLFEEALLESAVLQREVVVAQELRAGLAEASDQLLEVREPFLQKLHNVIRSTMWAYSSTAVAIVAAVWLVREPQPVDGTRIVDAIVYVENMRSSKRQQIEVTAEKNTLLSIDAAAFANNPVTLSISGSGDEYLKLGPLYPNIEMEVNVPVRLTTPGSYQLSISNASLTIDYELIVRKPE